MFQFTSCLLSSWFQDMQWVKKLSLYTIATSIWLCAPVCAQARIYLSAEGQLSSQEQLGSSSNVAHSSLKLSLDTLTYRFDSTQGLIIRDLFSGSPSDTYKVMNEAPEYGQDLVGGGVRLTGLQRHSLRLNFGESSTRLQLQYQAVRAQRASGLINQDTLFDHQLFAGRFIQSFNHIITVNLGYQRVSFGELWFQQVSNSTKGDDASSFNLMSAPLEARELKSWGRGEVFAHLQVNPPISGTSLSLGYVLRDFSDQRLITDGQTSSDADDSDSDETRRDQLLYSTALYKTSLFKGKALGKALNLFAEIQLSFEKNLSNQNRVDQVLGLTRFTEDAYSYTQYGATPSLGLVLSPLRLQARYVWASRSFEQRRLMSLSNPTNTSTLTEQSSSVRVDLTWHIGGYASLGLYTLAQTLESNNKMSGNTTPDLFNHDAEYKELGLHFKVLFR